MQEPAAKLLFDTGAFTKAIVVPVPMGEGYHLHLVKFGRNGGSEIIERQRGGYRVFKSLDAAISTAHGIGFRRIETDLSSL
ncbi:TPA: plasmid replication protein RepB [Aeromonas veronii]